MADFSEHGGPAFPVGSPPSAGGGSQQYRGMSLRDYFAGQALVAITAEWTDVEPFEAAKIAKHSYCVADAMLAERKRQEDS